MKKLYFLIVSFLLVGLTFTQVNAQSTGEKIASFSSTIILKQNSYAEVNEVIRYDFGSEQKRGIFRDIPTQYVVEGDQGYKLEVSVLGVLRDGQPEPYEILYPSPSYLRLKIGDPDVYHSFEQEYAIKYTVGRTVVAADDGTEVFRFDVPGIGWQVPVETATTSVEFTFAEPTSSTCYQGKVGDNTQDCISQNNNSFSSSRTLLPGETTTVELAFAGDTFAETAELTTIELDPETPAWVPVAVIGGVSGIGGILVIPRAVGYARYRRRRNEEIAYPRYEPPKDIGPAEMGLLSDNSSSGAELSATLIQFAVTGHMKIVQSTEKKWYSKAEYELHKLKPAGKLLRDYEASLFDQIFTGHKEVVKTKDLSTSQTFAKANRAFHKRLKKNLRDLGFYKKVSVFSPSLASRMNDDGYKKWAEVEGFREYLKVTDVKHMEMFEAPELKPEKFSEYLPYAVALGVEKQWAEQFKDLNVQTDEWYQGPNPGLNAAYVASSLSSGLGSVAASANQSSGSSGSGGGFSGGGFGGGGGGSW